MSGAPQTASAEAQAAGGIPLPHTLKQKIKDGLLALSLANLCFIPAWFSQLYDADFGYFNNLPITPPTLLAMLANIIWLTLVVWVVLRARRRCQNRMFHLVTDVVFFLLLLIPLDFIRGWITWMPERFSVLVLQHWWLMLAAMAALAFGLWQHRLFARMAAMVVGVLSPLAFLTLAKIVLLCLGVIHLKQANSEPALTPPGAGPGRPAARGLDYFR